jgi:hypothetical protein
VPSHARSRLSTRGYTARNYALALFVIAYSIVAYWGGRVSPRGEFFPVFNWSLFTHVYPLQTLPELYVIRIGDRTLAKPLNYFELDSYFESARQRSVIVTKTAGRLRDAIVRGDDREVARLRKIIEARHLSGHGAVEYELRAVRFMAVDRWKDKDRIIDQQVLGRFRTGDDAA